MSDLSDALLAGQALTPDQRQLLEQDPAPTMSALLNKAQSGTPATSLQAVDVMVTLVEDSWPEVVQGAAIDGLIDALTGNAKVDAVTAIFSLGDIVWPRFMDRALEGTVTAPQDTVVSVLSGVQPAETAARLIESAKDETSEITNRKWSLRSLAQLLRTAEPTEPYIQNVREALLETANQDDSPELSAQALSLLTEIGEVDDIGEMDWDRMMTALIAQSLSAPLNTVVPILYSKRPAETMTRLVDLSQDDSADLDERRWALALLKELAYVSAEDNAPVRQALIKIASEDPSVVLKILAVRILIDIGASGYTHELGKMIAAEQDRGWSLVLLEYQRTFVDPAALIYLRRLAESNDPAILVNLVEVLRAIGSPDGIGILDDLLRYRHENEVLGAAVGALAELDVAEAIDPLVRVAVSQRADPFYRRQAIAALGRIGSEQAAQSLVDILAQLRDRSLESGVLDALTVMGDVARAKLIEAVVNSSAQVRQQARGRLAKGLSAGQSQELAFEVVKSLVGERKLRLNDQQAASVGDLLRSLTRRGDRTAVAKELARLALDSENVSPVHVLKELVGPDELASHFSNTLDPKAKDKSPQEQIARAEKALMEVPSERGIKILVRHQIARSQQDRDERLRLVTTGRQAGEDEEDLFTRLRQAGVEIFEDTASSRAKGAYYIMLIMNVASFLLTLVFTGLCFYFGFVHNPERINDTLQLVAGGGALLGGLLTVVQARLFAPVKAVQDSISNLAIVQMTFMGFISRLEQVRTVFQDYYLDSDYGLDELKETDAVLEDAVADALAQMGQFVLKAPSGQDS